MRRTAFLLMGVVGLFCFVRAGGFDLALNGGFFSQESKQGFGMGVAPGFRLSGNVSLEGEYFVYLNGSTLYGGENLWDVGLSLLIALGSKEDRKVIPYLAFGPSLIGAGPESQDISASLGGGVRCPLSPKFGLRFEARGFFRLFPSEEDEYPHYRHLWRLTAGVSIRL